MQDNIMEFEIVFEVLWYTFVPNYCTEQVACNGSGGITVTLMVYRSYHRLLEVVELLYSTVDSYSKSLLRNPSFTDLLTVFNVRCFSVN